MNSDELTPSQIFPDLRLGRYRFVLKPKGPMSLPAYQGSTWRGVIGNALLDVVCPWDKKQCDACPNQDNCAYHYLYEAGLNEKAFANLPRPYVFCTADANSKGLCVEMTLIGDAARFLPHVIAAWIRAGERGAGKGRGRFGLKEIWKLLPDGDKEKIYVRGALTNSKPETHPLGDCLVKTAARPPWTAKIQTPLRLRQNGRNAQQLDWPYAFKSLAIRLSLLSQHYSGGSRPEKSTWDNLMDFFAEPGAISNEVRWHDWKRFSSTQQTHVPMGGLVGASSITPVARSELWWQWWQTACLFHLGKGASMGLGGIRILNHLK